MKLKMTMVAMLVATQVHAENLQTVVIQAIDTNPSVKEIKSKYISRQHEIDQAKAGYKPTIDMNLGYGYEYTDSPGTRGSTYPKNDDEELQRGEAGIVLKQTLFDGYATDSEVDRQTARTLATEHELSAVTNNTIVKVAKAYLDVLFARDVIALSEENLQTHYRIQDQIKLRSDSGVGRRADFDQVRARVALVEKNLISSKVNSRDADTAFNRVVGINPVEELEPIAIVPKLPENVEDAVEQALANNPTMKQAAADVQAAFVQQKAARANNYPLIYAELSVNADNDLDGVDGYNNGAGAMLRMNYNLYNGGRDEARIAQTSEQILEAEQIGFRAARQVEEEVRLAWAALEATQRQIEIAEDQIKYSKATREAYEKQFNIGQRTLLDLLNADNELYEANISLVEAKRDNIYAQYRIAGVMGTLQEQFLAK